MPASPFGDRPRRRAHVDLTVAPGEVVAAARANGSGKSTLVAGSLGLTDHLGGDVELFGTPRREFREHTRVGYVPQRHTLSRRCRATVGEVVATGRLGHQGLFAPARRADRQVVDHALETVGLADRWAADVSTLSGGQQRRVLIARALASEPDVLLMDEPTAGVDAANQHVLADVLSRLAAGGTTMLLVTHELEALRDVVTRVVVVDLGRVTWQGPAADCHARPRRCPARAPQPPPRRRGRPPGGRRPAAASSRPGRSTRPDAGGAPA